MYESLFVVAIICAIIASGFLIASIAMFFGFDIPNVRKDMGGVLEQKQIEEIRKKRNSEANKKVRINVFEELEKKAKVKKNITQNFGVAINTSPPERVAASVETSVLRNDISENNPDFIVEKNIMFVSTNEVLL